MPSDGTETATSASGPPASVVVLPVIVPWAVRVGAPMASPPRVNNSERIQRFMSPPHMASGDPPRCQRGTGRVRTAGAATVGTRTAKTYTMSKTVDTICNTRSSFRLSRHIVRNRRRQLSLGCRYCSRGYRRADYPAPAALAAGRRCDADCLTHASRGSRMRSNLSCILALPLVAGAARAAGAQEQADPRTLIPSATLNAIAARVSGAQAHNHVLEMCPYERNRPPEEYTSGTYREAAYAEKTAKEYGFTDVHIERFPLGAKQWDGEMGELWVTEPGPARLITRYRDIATTLATGSTSGDVTAELVYAVRGDTEADYAGKDVKGKI